MSLGPVPRNVTVFPAGCQSLRVTWTPQAPTPPLTLIQYLVNFREQGSSDPYQDSTLGPGSSYTITNLTLATHYSVNVLAQTQLGYGNYCCLATASTDNGKVPSDQGIPCQHLAMHTYKCMVCQYVCRIPLLTL